MLVADFEYELPEERIAKFPPKERGATRLLVLNRKTGEYRDSYYAKLDEFLQAGDVLILNDTRVLAARLFGKLPDGRERELVVLEKHGKISDSDDAGVERVLYRGKLHAGDVLDVAGEKVEIVEILGNGIATARVLSGASDANNVNGANGADGMGSAAKSSSRKTLTELAEKNGEVPLPPYLHREATAEDKERYQTVWAKNTGSAAAPTASLNMTEELLARLKKKGVKVCYLTLHVGLGTFLPMRTEKVEDHKMHSEWFSIPKETLAEIATAKKEGGRVVALGTTVARTLEFYARTGQTFGEDDIFIYPGFEFKMVDALLTNFHAPKSTVLMLAAAFAGWDNLKKAYGHCVAEKYQFLSYGDSMLIC